MKHLKRYLLLVLLLSGNTLHANDNLLLYGEEISPGNPYLYLGTIIPIKIKNDPWVLRLWSDISNYEYDSGNTKIEAESRNLHIALGKQFIHRTGWLTAYLGYAYNNTTLDPVDIGNDTRGINKQILLSADGQITQPTCDHDINYGISYMLQQKAYWLRARPICWTVREHKVGFEIVNHGDANYNLLQLGGVLYQEVLNSDIDITYKAGFTFSQKSDNLPYIGFEITTRY